MAKEQKEKTEERRKALYAEILAIQIVLNNPFTCGG